MKRDIPHLPETPTDTFPYILETKVGEGAMGEVYRALEPSLNRRVAVKVISPKFLEKLDDTLMFEVTQRFIQEARALARLNHPNVVTVFRVGEEAGVPFLAMEWVEASPLDVVLKEHKRLSVPAAVRVTQKVLSALTAAHDAQIIHRDVKPGNISVDPKGSVKLFDFGISQMRGSEDEMTLTQPGMMLGTPLYADPEQLIGGPVDARTDLYALSAVLYEMLSGRPPFSGFKSIAGLLHAHQRERPQPLNEISDEISVALAEFVERGLSYHAEDRPASAADMLAELREVVRGIRVSQSNHSVTRALPVVLPAVPTLRVDAIDQIGLSTDLIASWPARSVKAINKHKLVRDLTERPLHAEPFCGGAQVGDAWLLFHDGLVYAIFDEKGGLGDEVFERLPDLVDATIYQAGAYSNTIPALAASLKPVDTAPTYESDVSDLVALQDRLSTEGFDGVLRIQGSAGTVLALFNRGKRVLDVIGGHFPGVVEGQRWESWIAQTRCTARVEARRIVFPALTYRQQLREARLSVIRPDEKESGKILEDRVAAAASVDLEPEGHGLGRGESTMQQLVHSDPAFQCMRYLVGQLPLQMEQHRRVKPWKRLLAPLAHVETVVLHHGQPVSGGKTEDFDGVTLDTNQQANHLVRFAAAATAESLELFVRSVLDASSQKEGESLVGGVLVARRFEENALETWLSLQKTYSGSMLRSALGSFSHAEGVFVSPSGVTLHILLVELTESGVYRPLMPA